MPMGFFDKLKQFFGIQSVSAADIPDSDQAADKQGHVDVVPPEATSDSGQRTGSWDSTLHTCKRHGVTKEATGHDEPRAFLLGFVSYVAMVQPELGAKLRAEVRALLAP